MHDQWGDKPLHYQALLSLERLVAGVPVGGRIPAERELARRLGFSREPIRHALQILKDRRILSARRGNSGTEVLRPLTVRTGLIGLSVPSIRWPTTARMVCAAEAAALAERMHIVLVNDYGRPEQQLAQIASFQDLPLDGLIIFPARDNLGSAGFTGMLAGLAERRISTVLIDRSIPGLDLPCVAADVAAGAAMAVDHLVARGRRRLAVLAWGDEAGVADWNRWSGVRAALTRHGLPPEPVHAASLGYGKDSCQAAREAVLGWIRADGGRPAFDAVLCFIDGMALGAFFALREAGLRAPDDVALTGFDDTEPALFQAFGLHLTTVAQPFEDIGRTAVERLMALVRSPGLPYECIPLLPPRLVVRASA